MLKPLTSGACTAWAVLLMLGVSLLAGSAAAQTGQPTGLQLSGDKPVQIEGDEFEVFEDEGRAVFTGNVRVVQGETVMRTAKLTIHYAGDAASGGGSITSGASNIEKLEAAGGVNISSGTQVATGETGVFDMDTQVLVLSGKQVTLSEDGNVATGCKLTVAMQSGRATLGGCGNSSSRPTILLQPNAVKGPEE